MSERAPNPQLTWARLSADLRGWAQQQFGVEATSVTFHLRGAGDASLPLPATARPEGAGAGLSSQETYYVGDFEVVVRKGYPFAFGDTCALVVKRLWKAHEEGKHIVDQATLLTAAGSFSTRLADLFKGHDAWGTLIKRVKNSSCYYLDLDGDDNPEE